MKIAGLDVHQKVGCNAALIEKLTHTATSSTLEITLAATVENPMISLVEVLADDESVPSADELRVSGLALYSGGNRVYSGRVAGSSTCSIFKRAFVAAYASFDSSSWSCTYRLESTAYENTAGTLSFDIGVGFSDSEAPLNKSEMIWFLLKTASGILPNWEHCKDGETSDLCSLYNIGISRARIVSEGY